MHLFYKFWDDLLELKDNNGLWATFLWALGNISVVRSKKSSCTKPR